MIQFSQTWLKELRPGVMVNWKKKTTGGALMTWNARPEKHQWMDTRKRKLCNYRYNFSPDKAGLFCTQWQDEVSQLLTQGVCQNSCPAQLRLRIRICKWISMDGNSEDKFPHGITGSRKGHDNSTHSTELNGVKYECVERFQNSNQGWQVEWTWLLTVHTLPLSSTTSAQTNF